MSIVLTIIMNPFQIDTAINIPIIYILENIALYGDMEFVNQRVVIDLTKVTIWKNICY